MASLYIYHFSTVVDFSSREVQLFYWTQELFVFYWTQEGLAQWLEHSVYNRGGASSSLIIGILLMAY